MIDVIIAVLVTAVVTFVLSFCVFLHFFILYVHEEDRKRAAFGDKRLEEGIKMGKEITSGLKEASYESDRDQPENVPED